MPSTLRLSARRAPADDGLARPTLEMAFRGHRKAIVCAAFQHGRSGGEASGYPSTAPHGSAPLMPRLLTAGADGAVMLWDARPTTRALRFGSHRGPVLSCDCSPQSGALTLLASCGQDGYARLWAPNLFRTSTTYPSSYRMTQQQQRQVGGHGAGCTWRVHTGAARAIRFALDGSSHLYTAGDDKAVKVWDVNDAASGACGRFLGSFNSRCAVSHTNWIRCLAVQSATGAATGGFAHCVASGGDDSAVLVWDTRSARGGPAHAFYEHTAPVRGLSFHSNGCYVASCDEGGAINVYDLRRSSQSAAPAHYGLLQHYANAHGYGGVPVNSVAFAPSADAGGGGAAMPHSSWLLSAGEDGTARVWDVVEGSLYCTVEAHDGPVRSVSFSDDAAYFATAGQDGVAMVWHTGLALRPLAAQSSATAHPPRHMPGSARERVQESSARTKPASIEHATRSSARAAHVDPSYAAWQQQHLDRTAAVETAASAPDGSVDGKAARPHASAATSSSLPAARPPLPPPASSSAVDTSASALADSTTADDARERSFERSEERYTHISSPQSEQTAHAQQSARDSDASATRRVTITENVVFVPHDPSTTYEDDEDERNALVPAQTRVQGASSSARNDIADRRLQNVENAVVSLMEYVQEENAHRDDELGKLHAYATKQHGHQQGEIAALKEMVQKVVEQQRALLAKLEQPANDKRSTSPQEPEAAPTDDTPAAQSEPAAV